MMNNKISGYVEAAGLTIVVLASALWITHWEYDPWLYAAGSAVFAIGRLSVQRFIEADTVTVKRLLRMRTAGVFFLLASAVLMLTRPGFYLGYNIYLRESSWLILFIVFVILEVFTTFRLSNELKKG